MKVLVDTSVWIDHINNIQSAPAQRLQEYIGGDFEICTCGVIATEFLQGLRKDSSVEVFAALFNDMIWLTPVEPGTYLTAATLFRTLRRQGISVRSTVDCLIAVLAVEGDASLLARDRDLESIIESGFLPGLTVA
jgi:predicted nucleic acid-binding protein